MHKDISYNLGRGRFICRKCKLSIDKIIFEEQAQNEFFRFFGKLIESGEITPYEVLDMLGEYLCAFVKRGKKGRKTSRVYFASWA